MIHYKIVTSPIDKQHMKEAFQLFFKSVYGQELDDMNWEHQFIHTPYEDSSLFLAYDDTQIIGSSLMIPQKYKTASDTGDYYLWTTSAIAKPYRAKGVYAKLLELQRNQATAKKKDFIFAFPNKLAYPVVKLFGGFKDLGKTELVKANIHDIDYNNIINTLVIDQAFSRWRFEHKPYRFYLHGKYVIIAKEFQKTLDVLAIYPQEILEEFEIEYTTDSLNTDIITLKSFLKKDSVSEVIDVVRGVYFPINKEIDYTKMKLNLLMSDVF